MSQSNRNSDRSVPSLQQEIILALAAIATVLLGFGLVTDIRTEGPGTLVLFIGFALSTVAGASALRIARERPMGRKLWAGLLGVLMLLFGLGGALLLLVLLFLAFNGGFGVGGRPLRAQGRRLLPELRVGSDWTRGERPDTSGLDRATRSALETLWLQDAQAEHASIPAFARISWLLAATGAPPNLMERAHQAGLEEIDHARRCFALAAGYGERSHSVRPMPDLLRGIVDVAGDPRVTLAVESLRDGCLLEGFGADMAAAAAVECRDPAVRDLLERIALEERSHAAFSWDLLAWALQAGGEPVRAAVAEAAQGLMRIRRPIATSAQTTILVSAADPRRLREHGRLPDTEWVPLWDKRLAETAARVAGLLHAETEEVVLHGTHQGGVPRVVPFRIGAVQE